MSCFIDALTQYGFLQYALVGGILASIGCGIVGTYVVVKRIGFIAGDIAHAVLSGMGVAYFLGRSPPGRCFDCGGDCRIQCAAVYG